MSKLIEITESNYDEVLSNNDKIMFDFYADWCGPCKMLTPIITQLAEENADITISKINASNNIDLANKYQVTSIPCLIFVKNGEEVARHTGVLPKSKLQEKINEYLN